jgi:hypothetical protein
MKSAGFFWFQIPELKHEEDDGGEGKSGENPDRSPMEEPEAGPCCGVLKERAERCDFGGEEEAGSETAQTHEEREGDPKTPPSEQSAERGESQTCPRPSPIEDCEHPPH